METASKLASMRWDHTVAAALLVTTWMRTEGTAMVRGHFTQREREGGREGGRSAHNKSNCVVCTFLGFPSSDLDECSLRVTCNLSPDLIQNRG